MPALQAPRKISRRQELRQDAVVTATAKAVKIFENYRTVLIGAGIAVLIAIAAFVGYRYYLVVQGEKAAAQLGAIIGTYEKGLWQEALDGTTDKPGLAEIANRYGSTDDGNLARFYAGDALYRLDRKDESLKYFEAYDKGDNFLGAAAYAAEAAIYEDKGDLSRAGTLYHKAATVYNNNLTSPEYLISAARNFEDAGDYAAAREMYTQIKDRFPDADVTGGLDFYFARLDALQGDL